MGLQPAVAGEDLLVGRAAAGDEEAIAALYDRFARPLYAFGLARLGDHQLAEEFVQRVMTKLWRQAGRYDGARGSVRTWVFAIARNAVVDVYRRSARWEPPAEPPDQLAVADELEGLLRAEVVRVALDRLSGDHREVLLLAYFGGLSQAEIAGRLGVPLGTVKSRTFYALKAFRLACEELGIEL